MKNTKTPNSLFEKEMAKTSFRKNFETGYPFFQIEVQLLNELERNNLTYLEFARLIGTQKSNISRDLRGGGVHHATLDRIKKMANALNCMFIPLIIPKEKGREMLPRIAKIIAHV